MRTAFLDLRIIPALIGGGIIAFGLFLFMHYLIANNQTATNAAQQVNLVNFVQVQKQEQVQRKNYNVPPPPPPPKRPPPKTQVQTTNKMANTQAQQLPTNLKLNANSLGSGTGVYIGQSGPATDAGGYAPLTPMVRIKPIYPPEAQYQGVEGTVSTCFTVNPDGSVSNPHVTHASSPQARQMLAQAALRTILQWKFFPQKVDGKPVATKGVCQDIVFTMHGNGGG